MSTVSVHNINIYDNPFIIINMLYCEIPLFINMSILCTLTEINIHSYHDISYHNYIVTKNPFTFDYSRLYKISQFDVGIEIYPNTV